jgi:hypothetical protein
MGGTAGFKDTFNRRVPGAEAMELISVEALTVDDAPGAVGAGEFEDHLCEVDGDERSIHVGVLLCLTRLAASSLRHYDAGKERQGESVSSPQRVQGMAEAIGVSATRRKRSAKRSGATAVPQTPSPSGTPAGMQAVRVQGWTR